MTSRRFWRDLSEIGGDLERVIGRLETVERFELRILLHGGVTADDVHHALDAWARSHRVTDDWGYLRAVMLRRAADRMALQLSAPATPASPE